jgi:hypothetical protein
VVAGVADLLGHVIRADLSTLAHRPIEGIGDVELVVVVSYQACGDVSCLAPTEAKTPIRLTSRPKM